MKPTNKNLLLLLHINANGSSQTNLTNFRLLIGIRPGGNSLASKNDLEVSLNAKPVNKYKMT